MATLTLHDVPEDLVARLEERAHAHGRTSPVKCWLPWRPWSLRRPARQWLNLLQNL
jgi:hypothetical protein